MTAVSSGAAEVTGPVPEASATENPRLAILLAMAMFVLVVDTSIMNVSISSVVRDLGTTVSDVQAAIAILYVRRVRDRDRFDPGITREKGRSQGHWPLHRKMKISRNLSERTRPVN